MRVKLGADDGFAPDYRPHARQEVAFAIVVAVRHHRAVQAENHRFDGERSTQLPEDLVTQRLVSVAADHSGRLRRGAGALDQYKVVSFGSTPRHYQRRTEKMRLGRVRAGRAVK